MMASRDMTGLRSRSFLISTPLIEPEDVPLFSDAKMTLFLRDRYRRKYLEAFAPDTKEWRNSRRQLVRTRRVLLRPDHLRFRNRNYTRAG